MRGPLEIFYGMDNNDGIERCIQNCEPLFRSARKSIRIVSGALNNKFYDDSRIINALKKAIENRVSIEIISGPEIDKESKEILELYEKGEVSIMQLEESPKLHFTVIDEKSVKLEDFHSSYETPSHARYERKGIVLPKLLLHDYTELKRQAKPLPKGKAA